jgi:hypothetical protein
MRIVRAAVALATGTLLAASLTGQQPAHNKPQVTFKSGQLTLAGVVYKPDGPGPFSTVIWNHGSEKTPGSSRQFDAVADIFVPAGYAVVAPSRRGHDSSEGTNISDLMDSEEKKVGRDGAGRLVVRLLETEQLNPKDASLEAARVLGVEDRKAGKDAFRTKVYSRDECPSVRDSKHAVEEIHSLYLKTTSCSCVGGSADPTGGATSACWPGADRAVKVALRADRSPSATSSKPPSS